MNRKLILDTVEKCIYAIYQEKGHDPEQLNELFEAEASIVEDANLYFDMSFDSVDTAELIIKISDATNINIPDSELVNINTIGDLVNAIEEIQCAKTVLENHP